MKKNKELSPLHKKYIKTLKRNKLIVALCQIGVLVIFLAAWELCVRLKVIDGFIFSSPVRVWNTLAALINDNTLWTHIWISTKETVIGFLIGTSLGTLIAIILWAFESLRKIFEPYLVVLNALPKIALGPIIIIWIGTGQNAIITMAVLVSVIVTTLSMLSGFIETNPDKILLMRTMRASKFQIFAKLVLPSNIPTFASVMKINVGMAWVGTIMGEYLVSKAGLGYLLVYGTQVFKLDLVMTCTIILCLLAGLMYFLVALIEKFIRKR